MLALEDGRPWYVQVSVAGSSSTTGTGDDYYYGIPTVSAVSPNAGPIGGGTPVTLTGTNFVTGAEVFFGGTTYPATNVVVVSGTSITCVAPAHTSGVVDVTVKTTAGTSSTTALPEPTASPLPSATAAPAPATSTPAPAPDPAAVILRLEAVVAGLESPTGIVSPGDGSGRLFILEQPGRIRIVDGGRLLEAPFLDIVDRVGSQGNEQGLLGLAFHPRYAENGRFFVNYTDRDGETVISAWSVR